LAERQVIAFLDGVVVQMDADQAWGETAQMLSVIEEAEFMFGGGVTEVVPVTEGGGRETRENPIPEIIGWNFARVFAAFEAEAEPQGLGALTEAE
jgi:hypothetical protein